MHASNNKILSLSTPPAPLVKISNGSYKTIRNGIAKTIYVVGCKGTAVTYKEAMDRIDSTTIPLAKFMKFYQPA
jgi:hypothetical protein